MARLRAYFSPQPVIHSWWADLFGLHFGPWVFALLFLFFPGAIAGTSPRVALEVTMWVLLLDWGHIFAQWFRIYSNPLESMRNRWLYPASLIILVIFFWIYLRLEQQGLATFLVYLVMFHFMKQQYGYLRYLGRDEYRHHPWMRWLEDSYFYLGVLTPILSWHVSLPGQLKQEVWGQELWRHAWFTPLFWLSLTFYALSALFYWGMQWRLCRENRFIPLTKYLLLIMPHLGWASVSLFPEQGLTYRLLIILYHDASYFYFVWAIARRDQRLQEGESARFFHWTSWAGLPIYVLAISLVSDVVRWLCHEGRNFDGLIERPSLLLWLLPEGWTKLALQWANQWLQTMSPENLSDVAWATFFAIQAHHYFIDRFLWKKEKDYAWHLRHSSLKS